MRWGMLTILGYISLPVVEWCGWHFVPEWEVEGVCMGSFSWNLASLCGSGFGAFCFWDVTIFGTGWSGTLPQRDLVCNTGFFYTHNSYFAQLRVKYHLWSFLECEALLTVTHTRAIFRTDYCNMLYRGLPLKNIQKLQLVQLNFVPWFDLCLGNFTCFSLFLIYAFIHVFIWFYYNSVNCPESLRLDG